VQGDLKTFNRLCGTYAYIAPEMFKGAPASDKSDVFGMGIVLWELINTAMTGVYSQPYEEFGFTMDVQIMVNSSEGLRPTIPNKTPMSIVEIFQCCCDPLPEKRPLASEAAESLRVIYTEFVQNQEKWRGSRPYMQPVKEKTAAPEATQVKRNFSGWVSKSGSNPPTPKLSLLEVNTPQNSPHSIPEEEAVEPTRGETPKRRLSGTNLTPVKRAQQAGTRQRRSSEAVARVAPKPEKECSSPRRSSDAPPVVGIPKENKEQRDKLSTSNRKPSVDVTPGERVRGHSRKEKSLTGTS